MEKQTCLMGLAALLLTILRTYSSKTCAEFYFPTILDSSLTVLEGTNLSIPFTINYTEDCTPAGNFSLRVTRIAGDSEAEPQCSLRHRHKNCLIPAGPSKCTCPSGGKPYQLIHRFDRSDSLPTEWVWSVDDNHSDERRIHFEVCSLIISPADHFDIQPGATNIQLNVQTHSREFPQCALQRQASKMACSVTNIKGTPPDLVLTVQLDHVRKQDEGQWTLTLTNDVGKGHLDISLTFTETTSPSSNSSGVSRLGPTTSLADIQSLQLKGERNWLALVIASVAALFAVMAVVFAACRLYKKKPDHESSLSLTGFSSRQSSCVGSQPGISARFAQSEECVMIHNVIYQRSRSLPEIPDSPDADVRDQDDANLMDFDNSPQASLPGDLEGDYAEVGQGEDEPGSQATEDDVYVPVSEILERKKNQSQDERC